MISLRDHRLTSRHPHVFVLGKLPLHLSIQVLPIPFPTLLYFCLLYLCLYLVDNNSRSFAYRTIPINSCSLERLHIQHFWSIPLIVAHLLERLEREEEGPKGSSCC